MLEFDYHRKLQALVRELNRLYRAAPGALPGGFPLHRLRMDRFPRCGKIRSSLSSAAPQTRQDFIVFFCNFTPVPRKSYEFGVPEAGFYEEIFNTDSEIFGGSNMGNGGLVRRGSPAQSAAQHFHHAAAAGRGGVPQAVVARLPSAWSPTRVLRSRFRRRLRSAALSFRPRHGYEHE